MLTAIELEIKVGRAFMTVESFDSAGLLPAPGRHGRPSRLLGLTKHLLNFGDVHFFVVNHDAAVTTFFVSILSRPNSGAGSSEPTSAQLKRSIWGNQIFCGP